MAERQMMDDEKWARFGVGVAHTIGSVVLTAFGGGAATPAIGQLEGGILDSAFADRIDPATPIKETVVASKSTNTGIAKPVDIKPAESTYAKNDANAFGIGKQS